MSVPLDVLRTCWPTAKPHTVVADVKIEPGREFHWYGAYHKAADQVTGGSVEIDGHVITDVASISYVLDKDERPILLVGILCEEGL